MARRSRARFDAAQFASLAREAVAEIRARGRIPILCGGTRADLLLLRCASGSPAKAPQDGARSLCFWSNRLWEAEGPAVNKLWELGPL